jgi:ankyrin repeat protein
MSLNAELVKAVKQGVLRAPLTYVQSLLDKGADVNARDEDGNSALIIAISFGNTDVAEMLLRRGADVNARNESEETALMASASTYFYNPSIVKMLLDRGADINASAEDGVTALMLAARNNHIDMVKSLLARGVDVSAKDDNGDTALASAEKDGNTLIISLLKSGPKASPAVDEPGGLFDRITQAISREAADAYGQEIPLGRAEDYVIKEKWKMAVAVNEARAKGRLSDAVKEFLKIIAGSSPDLSNPPLFLDDVPFEVLELILKGTAKTYREFLEPWADSISKNVVASKLASSAYLRSKEGLQRTEKQRRTRVCFRATLRWAVIQRKISQEMSDSLLKRAGLPVGR